MYNNLVCDNCINKCDITKCLCCFYHGGKTNNFTPIPIPKKPKNHAKKDALTLQLEKEATKAREFALLASERMGCEFSIMRHYTLKNAYFIRLKRDGKVMYKFDIFFVGDKLLMSTGVYNTDNTGLVVADANIYFYHCKELKEGFNIVDEIINQERSRFAEWMKGVFNKLVGESHDGNVPGYDNIWYDLTRKQVCQNIAFFHDCMRKEMHQCEALKSLCKKLNIKYGKNLSLMETIKVESANHLQKLVKEGKTDFFIRLGCARSSKFINEGVDKDFFILNLIDDTEEELSKEDIFNKEKSNIGEAITKGLFFCEVA